MALYQSIDTLCGHFGQVELLEFFGRCMLLKVPKNGRSTAEVFGFVEQLKVMHGVGSYRIQQNTLESIF